MIIIGAVLSVSIGSIFLASAVPKLRHPKGFLLAVLEYRVLPPALARLYALLVPPLELLIALLLFSGTAVRLAAALAALLLLSFLIAVGINVARGRNLDCQCFSKAAHRPIGWGLLFQDVVLVGAAVVLTVVAQTWGATEAWSVFRLAGLSSLALLPLLVVCTGVIIGTLLLRRHATWSNSRKQGNGLQKRRPSAAKRSF